MMYRMFGRFCATTGAGVGPGKLSSPHDASATRLATAAPIMPRRREGRCDRCVVIVVVTGYVGSPMVAMTSKRPKFDFCVAMFDRRYRRCSVIPDITAALLSLVGVYG